MNMQEHQKLDRTECASLFEAWGFSGKEKLPRIISFVGAGGKTTTMYQLAGELAARGSRVLITTTTHIRVPETGRTAQIAQVSELGPEHWQGERLLTAGRPVPDASGVQGTQKLTMPEGLDQEAQLARLLEFVDVILIEADGAKEHPLKVPEEGEPVIVPQTGLVVACVGLSVVGQTFGKGCFRFEQTGAWLMRKAEDPVAPEDVALILMDGRGAHKQVQGRAYRIVLNQADGEADLRNAEAILRLLPLTMQKHCAVTAYGMQTQERERAMIVRREMWQITCWTETGKRVLIKGAGDLASGIALRLHRCGCQIVMTELAVPTTVRRTVAFSPAVYEGISQVEDVTGICCDSLKVVEETLKQQKIAVVVDEKAEIIAKWKPDVVVDAILAKRNLGTRITDARMVIGVGPGFTAGVDCHCVVETKRGHYLGRCIWEGSAIENTGVPGEIGGYGIERLIRSTGEGTFRGTVGIGEQVEAGALVGYAGDAPVYAQIAGAVRGILQDGVSVYAGMKAGDVDPRCAVEHCFTVSDKATAIGGGVLEAMLHHETLRPCDVQPAQRIALVLLAAGDSRRFRGNKLLAELDHKPMYRHIADQIAACAPERFAQKLVVSQYPEILEDLNAEGYLAVENRDSSLGVSHSIHLALEHLEKTVTAICFAVCDQPWLTCRTIEGLLAGWERSGKGMGCPTCGGNDGNPAVFSRSYEKALFMLEGDVGGRKVMKRFPEDVYRFAVSDERELADLDEAF
ncbi:MAG: selenium-dependent molybdenum cofactor biosynthesis protein YqeB [Lachnospiraceae bacterium]|nr:selenium-dependent molybdenum cofactor biosynthesis protein YqeB [Lachnospiraceae bacterium]